MEPDHRRTANRNGLRYPSDLTDDEWVIVAPMIPPARQGGRKRSVDVREVLNGIFYVLWTGCQWKALPKDLPPKSTVHDYLELWNWDGTLLDRQSERPQSHRRPEYSPLGCGAGRLSWRLRYCLIAQLKRINLRLAASIRYTLRVARRSGNLKQCVTRMQDHKSAQEHLKKAEQCFDLGDEGHDLAEKIHDSAAKQLDMAAKQKSMGAEQHLQADKIEAQAASRTI